MHNLGSKLISSIDILGIHEPHLIVIADIDPKPFPQARRDNQLDNLLLRRHNPSHEVQLGRVTSIHNDSVWVDLRYCIARVELAHTLLAVWTCVDGVEAIVD